MPVRSTPPGNRTTSESAVAVITGGASGIGAALARALAERGDVVVIADLDESGAQKLAAELAEAGHQARAQTVDVRDLDRMKQLIETTLAEFGRVDYMFNNAGVVLHGGCEELTPEQWDFAIGVNLRGVINGISAAYPVMLRQGDGHIVNMASVAGLVPTPMAAPYGTTKHAVVGLSTALRAEAAGRGVRVSVVCPGFIDTEMPQKAAATEVRKFFYPVDRFADDVLSALEANRGYIVLPRSARFLWRIQRLAPGLGDRIAARFTERAHRGAPPMLPVRMLAKLRRSPDSKKQAA